MAKHDTETTIQDVVDAAADLYRSPRSPDDDEYNASLIWLVYQVVAAHHVDELKTIDQIEEAIRFDHLLENGATAAGSWRSALRSDYVNFFTKYNTLLCTARKDLIVTIDQPVERKPRTSVLGSSETVTD